MAAAAAAAAAGEGLRNEAVTVKFRFADGDGTTALTRAFDLDADVAALRSHVRRSLGASDPARIAIERAGSVARDGQTLRELGAAPLGTFEVDVRGCAARPPRRGPAADYLPPVDVIAVNVAGRGGRTLVVEIERCGGDGSAADGGKPWLGGYRDRVTGRAYHHAAAQTDFRPRAYAATAAADERTQTCADKGADSRASRCAATQTRTDDRDGCGRLVARPYRSYRDERLREDRVLTAVLTVQRAFRRTRETRRRRRRLLQANDDGDDLGDDDDVGDRPVLPEPEQSAETSTTTLECKQQHFYALYTMIGKWWKRERQRVKGIEAENARRAAQMKLLKKEIQFLLEVEKQRAELKYELTKHDDMTFLNKTSKPKMFKNKAGRLLTVDTVGNQKARELRDIYAGLTSADGGGGGSDFRAELLDRVCAIASGSCYKYKRNLLDAVALERALTATRADARGLRSVRGRVEQMFRHFVRQPEVNPEADSYGRPGERRVLNVYTCIRCKRNLAATDFSLESRVNRTNVCANCEWTEQVGHKRIDMAPYRRMLKALRRDEMQMAAYQSECFLMQPTEVYRLVSVVWNERSAVSECGQLNGLRLVRWHRHRAWSPWNCLLLTRAEARAHCLLDGDPADCYDARFVRWVTNRHLMARLQFANLVHAVKNRTAAAPGRAKPLSKHWKTVADRFDIKTTCDSG